ncbi:MAG: hypothetical protein J1F40_04775 [Prevotellaceae bacterium]|nr:hypothetical protein [Prevotellaceae bacterium]
MRTSFMRFMLCAVVAVAFTACDKEIYNENGMLPDGTTADGAVPEGYFRATFFPEQGGDASTRIALDNEYSKAIQSLICIIYQKQSDGTFRYLQEMPVLTYDGPAASEGGISDKDAKDYLWPLKNEVTFLLPYGEYKAVFVGNSDKNLFEGQDGQLLSDYKQRKYDEARLCMPDKGPVAFNNYNMFYLCTVEFSEKDFAEGGTPPHVLMQRVVSSNIYGRKTVDVTNDVRDVVNNLVDEIMKNDNLLEESVRTLLKSNLLSWLNDNPGIKGLLDVTFILFRGADGVVSQLTQNLVGPLLDALRKALLDELTKQLQSAIQGDTNVSLLGLGYVLAPWEHVYYVEITYASLPKNINFDRKCTSFEQNAGPYKYKLDDFQRPKPEVPKETEEFRTLTVTTFCGKQEVSKITVNSDGIVGGLFDVIDGNLLDGLLVNIQNTTPPLIYPAESNRQYTTFYDLLNVELNDVNVKVSTPDDPLSDGELEGMKPVKIDLNLVKDVLNLRNTLGGLLGPLGYLLGGVLEEVLGFVEDVVGELLGGDNGIKIYLPSLLDVNNISVTGQWSETEVSFSNEKIPHVNP